MILINMEFYSNLGVSKFPLVINNKYDFFNGITVLGEVLYNSRDFYKLVKINGKKFNNENDFYKEVGVSYGLPIFNEASFMSNVTFDNKNIVGNQYKFYRDFTNFIN